MIPVHCTVKHDPNAGTYGDCLRACIASILETDAVQVPHFLHDNCDATTMVERLNKFLAPRYSAVWMNFPGDETMEAVLAFMTGFNGGPHFLLFGSTVDGDHVVIGHNGEVVFDPAWFPSGIVGPNSAGFWAVVVICLK